MTGWSAVTLVDTSHSPGTVTPTSTLWRLLGISSSVGPATSPAPVMNVSCAVVVSSPGFCTSTQVSKPPLVQPSARYHVSDSLSLLAGGVPNQTSQPVVSLPVPAYAFPSKAAMPAIALLSVLPNPSRAPGNQSFPSKAISLPTPSTLPTPTSSMSLPVTSIVTISFTENSSGLSKPPPISSLTPLPS